jgi:hypothetical protein
MCIETLLSRAETLVNDLDPLAYVTAMRANRNYMVQTLDQ